MRTQADQRAGDSLLALGRGVMVEALVSALAHGPELASLQNLLSLDRDVSVHLWLFLLYQVGTGRQPQSWSKSASDCLENGRKPTEPDVGLTLRVRLLPLKPLVHARSRPLPAVRVTFHDVRQGAGHPIQGHDELGAGANRGLHPVSTEISHHDRHH